MRVILIGDRYIFKVDENFLCAFVYYVCIEDVLNLS